MTEPIHLAANNPDLGGGEQMLVRTARALRELGREVVVVAPDTTTEVLDAAADAGAAPVAIRARDRSDYLRRLRAWHRFERPGLLWCHGLVPSLATGGRPRRVVHLHQQPRSRAQRVALEIARSGCERVLTPSASLAGEVRGAHPLPNWTDEVEMLPRASGRARRLGFLGRLSTDKGLDTFAEAMRSDGLETDLRLVVAGDDRWVPTEQRIAVDAALGRLGDRVERVGRVSPRDLFGEVDLVVFPSRVAESFGLVVAEAMAAGVPFVVSDAGALPEVAGPDHPWVARAGDADALARTIATALGATPEEVVAVTDRARQRWQDEYSPRAGRARVARLLEELDA